MAKTKAFSDLSAEVRKRPGAAEEIDARRRTITAAVRLGGHIDINAVFDDDVVSLGPVDRIRASNRPESGKSQRARDLR